MTHRPGIAVRLVLLLAIALAGFIVLVGFGLYEMDQVAVGSPLYDELRTRARLRESLVRLRTNVAEIRSESVGATHDPQPAAIDAFRRRVREAVVRRRWTLGLGGAVLTIAVVAVGLVVTRSIVTPLRALVQACDRVASGDLSAHVNIGRTDELGDLAGAFDRMVDEVARAQAALAAAEARYRDIANHAVEGLFQGGVDGRVLWVNEALAKLYGYDSPADMIAGIRDVKREMFVDARCRDELYERLGRAGAVDEFEIEVYRKDGSTMWASQTVRAIRDDAGRLVRYEGSVRDITARRRLDEARSDFVSFATHQLRTPLSGMKWMLELAVGEPDLPDDAAAYIGDARAAAQRLIDLVNQLLDVSRLEAGRFVPAIEAVALDTLTAAVVADLRPALLEHCHLLEVEIEPGLPLVAADARLLREVVMNLLGNAIKYTPAAGRITIRAARDDRRVRWQVSDTGRGIPEEARARIFEKFYRADNVVGLETEGTGLGLCLSRLIVEKLGGRLWFESAEAQGSTFFFTIPIAGVSECPETAPASSSSKTIGSSAAPASSTCHASASR
jgi:PAS domain S-box-containing protein